jgi:hypothetical protein
VLLDGTGILQLEHVVRTSQRPLGSAKIRQAYAFLLEVERAHQIFTREAFAQASGWTEKTTRANLSKKLSQYVQRVDGGYRSLGITALTEENFCRLCSQNVALAGDPQRPFLSDKVEEFVYKARESALAAVQHYNNPTAVFRSGNYIVLMIIGYTALFHAIFERDRVDYIEQKNDGTPKLTADGEAYHWDAVRCARYYAQHYADRYEKGLLVAMAHNLEFIFPIRHSIEHRHMPELDVDICGHCQAILMNFELMLTCEFTHYYALNPSLNLALQFSTRRSPGVIAAIKRFQSAEYAALQTYISKYHADLPHDIAGNPAFEFRVWLIQKPANRERGADLSIEFVRTDQLSDEDREKFQEAIVAVKAMPSDPSKECKLWEKDVLKHLQERLGITVQFDGLPKRLTNTMIRWARDAHAIKTPSNMYYRPTLDGSRAMYDMAFVEWLIERYAEDPDFFYNAKITIARGSAHHRE